MLRRSILVVGYLLIFAAAAVCVVDGTRWVADGVLSFTSVSAALHGVGVQLKEGEWLEWPAVFTLLSAGLTCAVGAILALGGSQPKSEMDL